MASRNDEIPRTFEMVDGWLSSELPEQGDFVLSPTLGQRVNRRVDAAVAPSRLVCDRKGHLCNFPSIKAR